VKILAGTLTALLVFSAPIMAQEAQPTPPTEESVRELLNVMDMQKVLDQIWGQMGGMMKGMRERLAQGQKLTPEQQKTVDAMQEKMVAVLKEELNWKQLEPIYLKIYRDSFSQSEVDGMLAFYRGPTGQAVIKKLPRVMQGSMAAMQERMVPIVQKIQKMARETAEELKKQQPPEPSQQKPAEMGPAAKTT
jgi:uncharacterized protein